jgi:hypothetical protein
LAWCHFGLVKPHSHQGELNHSPCHFGLVKEMEVTVIIQYILFYFIHHVLHYCVLHYCYKSTQAMG